MDPQQELFTELLLKLKDLGYDVYDTFLPPEGTPYPFVYLADSRQTDTRTKSTVIGNVYQARRTEKSLERTRRLLRIMRTICRKRCLEKRKERQQNDGINNWRTGVSVQLRYGVPEGSE